MKLRCTVTGCPAELEVPGQRLTPMVRHLIWEAAWIRRKARTGEAAWFCADHTGEAAMEELAAAGLEPTHRFQGRSRPMALRCCECGAALRLSLDDVREGARCKHPARRRLRTKPLSAETAEEELRGFGFLPEGPYPLQTDRLWKVRCAGCGRKCRTSLKRLRAGFRCPHTDPAARPAGGLLDDPDSVRAEAEIRGYGFEPMEPYPGRPGARWKRRCVECGVVRTGSLRQQRRAPECPSCRAERDAADDRRQVALRREPVTEEEAVAEARRYGFEPEEPFPGASRSWKKRCGACGQVRMASLSQLRAGQRCRHQAARQAKRQPRRALL